MDALVGFHFQYDSEEQHESGRSFVIKFDVTPDERLANIIRMKDEDFDQRLTTLIDSLDINYAEEWPSGDCDLFGWLTNCHDEHGDPLKEVERVRDFFLQEGFRGGQITEMTGDEHEVFVENNHAQALLENELARLGFEVRAGF